MEEQQKKPVILSAIQPSGIINIGIYSGALRNWAALQDTYDCLYGVVDMHTITVRQEPAVLRRRTLDNVAMYIACGIDPEKNTIFIQSQVPQHAELAWVLNCFTGMGECSRMTQFKDKSAQHAENINVGLFAYPILMAADILLYQTDLVPVGADQKQHLELARNLAERFNFHYSPTFTVPEVFIPPVGAKIMSLQEPTKKMSKSDPNEKANINLTDSDDVIINKIKRAVTDSGTDIKFDESRPGVANLMTLYNVATGKSFAEIEAHFDGKGYGDFKKETGEAVAEFIKPIRTRFEEIRADQTYLETVLKRGGEAARGRARKTLSKVYKKVGFVQF
jgi:tryptophanyl-tRNA synthetase